MVETTRQGAAVAREIRKRPGVAAEPAARHWTFLSNHGHVLVCLARDPEARLRDVAQSVGITERAVQKIVSDLEEAGVVERLRDGRRNRYRLHPERPLRHPIESHRTIGALLSMVLNPVAVKRLSAADAGDTDAG
ncbi:MAG: winged helix-turn-helix domain-containing protein [Steroidobacteraceae bacterium]|jgi:DNA-binding transcriptional ArsR family regulator|nr:winged helix-turn-helix domain-containing protein [Steroidobacteraceae bacterium]